MVWHWNWALKAIKLSLKTKNIHDKLELEQDCIDIINSYELDCCDTVSEFIYKFDRLPADLKTKFLKCHPYIYEYLEHAEINPGIPFTFRSR